MPSLPSFRSRTALLIGEEGAERLARAKVFIAGLGGVGGTAFESLLRSGVSSFFLVDGDSVDITNLNRQILFTQKDLGRPKAEAARERALSINPDCQIEISEERIDGTWDSFPFADYDVILDCIDDVNAKAFLIKKAEKSGALLLSSLGMGFRRDPTKVKIDRMEEIKGDRLGKALRQKAKEQGISLRGVLFAHSEELPASRGAKVASMMMVPSASGLALAYATVDYLLSRESGGK